MLTRAVSVRSKIQIQVQRFHAKRSVLGGRLRGPQVGSHRGEAVRLLDPLPSRLPSSADSCMLLPDLGSQETREVDDARRQSREAAQPENGPQDDLLKGEPSFVPSTLDVR